VPGFHKAWLNAMIGLFTDCNDVLISKLDEYAKSGEVSHSVETQQYHYHTPQLML
jgi:hypothetical protein